MDKDTIIQLVTLILSAIFGSGGLCAFIITIVKLNKKSKTYEVRCKLAAEFLRRDIVKMTPEGAKELFLDILDGKIDDPKRNSIADKVLKCAKTRNKTYKVEDEQIQKLEN